MGGEQESKPSDGNSGDNNLSAGFVSVSQSPIMTNTPASGTSSSKNEPPATPLGSPAATAIAAKIAISAASSTLPECLEPACKRIKIETDATIPCSLGGVSGTIPGVTASETVVGGATCAVSKPQGAEGTSSSGAKPASLTTLNPSTSVPSPTTSQEGRRVSVSVAQSSSISTNATTTPATQPQHLQNTETSTAQLQTHQRTESISVRTHSRPSTSATDNTSHKDQINPSSKIHVGSPSIVTASVASSSHSDNTSSNSSNDSLHEATVSRDSAPGLERGISASGSDNAGVSRRTITTTGATQPVSTASQSLREKKPTLTKPVQLGAQPTTVRKAVAQSTVTSTERSSKTSNNNAVPLKSLTFSHLNIKYMGELEYMLREFRKLERQLLGAKGAQQLEESVGSRERREKLHSFILHLEDTIRQIELGCKFQEEGKSASNAATDMGPNVPTRTENSCESNSVAAIAEAKNKMAVESALSNLTKEKEEEETVQKLEEHILANLLPVKVRLKKQLAAQQGATQNPPGMPARRGSLQPSSTIRGKGTFVEAAEKKRKHAESLRLAAQAQQERQVRSVTDPTQFGKPLSGIGSSLTKKLHGATLGSKQRRMGHGVGSSIPNDDGLKRKVLHGGMVPKSTQQESGMSAASGVHDVVMSSQKNEKPVANSIAPASGAKSITTKSPPARNSQLATKPTDPTKPTRSLVPKATINGSTAKTSHPKTEIKPETNNSNQPMSEEDKLKYKKHRRLRKLKRLKRRRERELVRQQQQQSQSKSQQLISNGSQATSNQRKKVGHSKAGQKKKGPRVVEYTCSQCSESYSSTCDLNPWWALVQHKCPKCQKTQVPRIDISSPANAIEYHPALLSHLDDGGRGSGGSVPPNNTQNTVPSMQIVSQIPDGTNDANSESDSDLSELSDDNISIGSLKAAELESDLQSMTPAERAEHETFGEEYDGPILSEEHASKLLILMAHAATCPGHHKSEKHNDVCRSTKYMMLHVRDCPGTTSTFDVCPFPWCRKVKHLLYHLVSCETPDQCSICSPREVPKGMKGLIGLNAYRMKSHRERMIAAAKSSLAAKSAKSTTATKKHNSIRKTASATQVNNIRKVISGSKLAVAQASSQSHPLPSNGPTPVKTKEDSVPKPKSVVISEVSSGTKVETSQPSIQQGVGSRPGSNILAQSLSVSDFDINAEIAKLDDQLGCDHAVDVNQSTHANDVAIKQEVVDTSIPVPRIDPTEKSGSGTTDYSMISAPNTAPSAPPDGGDHHSILPTPVASIKLVDDQNHDTADDVELRNLLAANSSIEESEGLNIQQQQPDVGDVSEYLENEYRISQHSPQDSVMVATEHQQQIDRISGIVEESHPNSDPLANIDHDILMDPTNSSNNDLGHIDPASIKLKEEYSEPAATGAPSATTSTAAAAAT